MEQEKIERAFETTGPAKLKLSNISGTITVEPGAASQVFVSAVKRLNGGDAERTRIEMRQEDDGAVVVETKFDAKAWLGLISARPCKVDYVVKMPVASSVDLSAVDAAISVRGLQGELSCRSVSGGIHLQDLEGNIHAHAVSGNIEGTAMRGELHLETVSGDVQLRDSHLDPVHASTVSGNIHLETPLAGGPYQFHSVSGDVHLKLPEPVPATLRLESISGDLRCPVPLTTRRSSRGHAFAQILGGGVEIVLKSVSGNLHLESPEGDSPASEEEEPVAVAAGQSDEARPAEGLSTREMLARLERGEMTVDQVLKAMKN